MTLQYELEGLETFIAEQLPPKLLLSNERKAAALLDEWTQFLESEKDGICKRIRRTTYGYTKENHRVLYIRQHQLAVIRLKNVLMDYLMPKNAAGLQELLTDAPAAKIYKRCFVTLGELLAAIKNEFHQYFDYDAPLPANKLLVIQDSLKTKSTLLRKQLLKAKQDPTLIELVLQTIHIHSHNETCQILTYNRWDYLKQFMISIERMSPGKQYASHYPPLIVQLVYMNFNATVFKNYMVQSMYNDIHAASSVHEKIEVISFHHKEISQLPVKQSMALAPTLPSVQLDLVTWLFTEMTHLEKKQHLGLVTPVQFKEPGDPDAEKGIYSQLTVEELGLFFKVQKETELLKNKNMKQVARSVAEHWHSKQKANISWQYLYNSMGTADVSTIRALEDKLVGMVNWLRKMRRTSL